MAKTVTAMLVGVAIAEGRIKSVDDRADQYVPELKGHPYGETPLRHLLTMSSGVRFVEDPHKPVDNAVLGRASQGQQGPGGVHTVLPFNTRERPPGQRYNYASAETQVLGLVVRAATGRTLSDYLAEKIWQPMGAEADAAWVVDRGGYETAFSSFNATLRDYARFGLLLAHDGARDGKQIIPKEWVIDATTVSAPHVGFGTVQQYFGYGYQTWLVPGKDRRFFASGFRGQAIFVDPKTKVVMVHMAARDGPDPGYREQVSLWHSVAEQVGRMSP
jgi:CubicO group peptidase (beta-lactamase class C family)